MTPKKIVAGVIAAGTLAGGGSLAVDASINPYQSVQVMEGGKTVAVLQIAAPSALPEAGTVASVVDTTQPKITLEKWDGKVALGVTYEGLPPDTTGGRPFFSKNVNWGNGAETMEAVPIDATTWIEDGGMEININLASKPATNIFVFQLDNWESLDFFYQPPLWQEAKLKAPAPDCTDTKCNIGGEGTSIRPNNVVGSYAVYYKEHANHKVGSTNYATGKAYHIYRPLVTDANGATTWADLSYSNGILTVTVSPIFLNSAAYPVKIDPTFGYTTIGASSIQPAAARGSRNNLRTAVSGDTVTQFSYACSGGTSNQGMAVYTDNGTNFVTRGTIVSFACGSTKQFYNSSTISQSLTGGTVYGVAIDASNSTNVFYRDTTGTNTGENSASATLDDPWVSSGINTSLYSIYATYTAGAAASTPAPNNNVIFFQ